VIASRNDEAYLDDLEEGINGTNRKRTLVFPIDQIGHRLTYQNIGG
jgi:hypothetical protein